MTGNDVPEYADGKQHIAQRCKNRGLAPAGPQRQRGECHAEQGGRLVPVCILEGITPFV